MGRTIKAAPRTHSVDEEIARLRDLDLKGLRARWRGIFRKAAPSHLPRHLLIGMIAYRLQADEFGDLDSATRRALEQSTSVQSRKKVADQLQILDRQHSSSAPGTVLMREWKGREHRVIVTADGFAWKGKTFKSLSAVAFSMTGTKWNGPRFFGLRNAALGRGSNQGQ